VPDAGIDLTTVIQQLRYDIERTWWHGQNSGVAMEVGPIELEVTVQVAKDKKAKLGVKFYVVDASVGGDGSATNTQRIKLTLTPRSKLDPTVPLLIAATADATDDLPAVPPAGD
jgi:hypothetical protein